MPDFSVIVPVYNEAGIVEKECAEFLRALDRRADPSSYEVVMVENGSTDETRQIVERMARTDKRLRIVSLPEAAYGAALKRGIVESTGAFIAIANIDYWDVDFFAQGLERCRQGVDIVIGSKLMKGAHDERPLMRRTITRIFNVLLTLLFHYHGTDTHGIKVLRRETIMLLVEACRTNREVFDTELLLRAQKAGCRIVEIPVRCREKRPVSLWQILPRIPRTARDVLHLYAIL